MQRRDFLVRGGLALGAAAATLHSAHAMAPAPRLDPDDWESVLAQFDLLDASRANFAGFFLVSHPRAVRAAIEKYRREFDRDPIGYWEENRVEAEDRVRAAAGEYLGVDGTRDIALTDSTTMGLAMLYTGLVLRDGQEILSSTHDHPAATQASLRFRAARSGAKVNQVPLYAESVAASAEEIVSSVERALTPRTRILALTWVHSCTGVKIPVRAVADAVARANANRDPKDRVIFCLDGVHGLGIENKTLPELGCDFFAGGTHKWILSPRGTGILWGRHDLWEEVIPTIPAFSAGDSPGPLHTPGGFHSFEHRWAADEGFKFHLALGKARVQDRIHALNHQIREGLSTMPHVDLHTPLSNDLASGIVCFDVKGKAPRDVIQHLAARNIIASVSPYRPSCARLAASLWNTPEQAESALRAVRELA